MYVIDWLAAIKSAAGRRNFGDSCSSPVSVPASNPLAGSPPVASAQRLCPSTAGSFRQLPIATQAMLNQDCDGFRVQATTRASS